ncbi:nucleotidyltransferase family protein [Ornithinimicrobium sp. INDO-MA30-4]|uniref:nucleotidyltransferase family protein n=1 Tax=Ornithinimicrobium sp. INDO-MA30-4 TaxID=2908651 RepID=UPI001F306932|nr:nucleotidyltransferase family protein [Ornithinimicrobium sp. INDO-MA30-4]UJH69875.1 nucleotidyltransferase family protein [Ornithinimicrobium sp. INDO-MA30-4]
MNQQKEVPISVRVRFAHAVMAHLAEAHDFDVLHVKGPAVAPGLRREHASSQDADILVRPSHLQEFLDAIGQHGWFRLTGFTTGSAFEHAAVYHHDSWASVDVHRRWPGFDMSPEAAFDQIWQERDFAQIAGISCPVPSRAAQSLILILHAARAPYEHVRERAIDFAWDTQPAEFQAEVRGLVKRLNADVGFAFGLGQGRPWLIGLALGYGAPRQTTPRDSSSGKHGSPRRQPSGMRCGSRCRVCWSAVTT